MAKCFSVLFALILSLIWFAGKSQVLPTPKLENVALEVVDSKGKSKTISLRLHFPSGPGNTGGVSESKAVEELGEKLSAKGVNCPPKRLKIGDNTWICGDGTKYTSNNKKLNALLEELWSGNE